MAIIIIGIMKNRTVNLTKLVHCLDIWTKISSRYKRLQRFFWHTRFDRAILARFLASFAGVQTRYTLSMDRTNRDYGKFKINILVLGIVYKWTAIPVLRTLLDKKWNSNSEERIKLVEEFCEIFGTNSIEVLLADREFIGHDRVKWLMSSNISFILRVRNNTLLGWYGKKKHIFRSFKNDERYTPRSLKRAREIRGLRLYVTGMKTQDEYLIVITKSYRPNAMKEYGQRREIETLFWDIKRRWFCFEDTHLQKHERISTMMWILAICVVRSHSIWERQSELKPITTKKHWRKQFSIFRYWLDFLRDIIESISTNLSNRNLALQFLSCT